MQTKYCPRRSNVCKFRLWSNLVILYSNIRNSSNFILRYEYHMNTKYKSQIIFVCTFWLPSYAQVNVKFYWRRSLRNRRKYFFQKVVLPLMAEHITILQSQFDKNTKFNQIILQNIFISVVSINREGEKYKICT